MINPQLTSDPARTTNVNQSPGNGNGHASTDGALEYYLLQRDAQLVALLTSMERTLTEIQRQLAAKQTPAPANQSDAPSRHERWSQYQELIPRIRATVAEAVPAGATVLVASKGDEELLKLPGCTGWHFPRSEGGVYAGHHPADSATAIAHLEALRDKGASYLLFPSTALWWLDHYKELRQHLESRYPVAARRQDICVIFDLGAGASSPTPLAQWSSNDSYQHLVRQIRELAGSILPAKATVLVVSKGDEDLLKLPGCTGWHFPRTDKGTYTGYNPADSAAAIAHLEALRAKGARYLIFPTTAYWWLTYYRDFRRHLEAKHRMVTRQRHVCLIYELAGK